MVNLTEGSRFLSMPFQKVVTAGVCWEVADIWLSLGRGGLITSAEFRSANTPTEADFKLPRTGITHWSQQRGKEYNGLFQARKR